MPEKSTLYLETTIPSYLTSNPSRDLIVAAHQQITHDWWSGAREEFDLYISEAVLEEISAGDPGAASRRLALVEGIPILALTGEIGELAEEYRQKLRLPEGAQLDAIHLACAVVNELEYVLTWNCKHLANGRIIQKLQSINLDLGRPTPIIVTPEELLDLPEGE